MDDDIGTLKEQVAKLQARTAQLENMQGRKVIPMPPVEERGVSISYPAPPPATDMPKARELAVLRDICRAAHPAWCDSDGYYRAAHRYHEREKRGRVARHV
jgi:hypothetical protein